MKEVERLAGSARSASPSRPAPTRCASWPWPSSGARDAKIDLLTIDGAPGGTGMSPWRMMEEWGIPTFYLQSHGLRAVRASSPRRGSVRPGHRLRRRLQHRGPRLQGPGHGRPVHQGGLHGPGPDDPGHGRQEHRPVAAGRPRALPKTVSQFGTTVEEIFVCYEDLVAKYGKKRSRRCRSARSASTPSPTS